jgi:beta-lactam-binding protein with PASTA domain
VPNVLGIRAPFAIKHLAAAGLRSRVTGIASSKPAGFVVRQVPSAQARVTRGALVTIAVSEGQRRSKPRSVPARSAPATVASSAPAPAVPLVVPTSAGTTAPPPTVSVPDVVGLKLKQARRQLRSAGLLASVVHVPSTEPSGTVVAQAPSANKALRRGTSVQVNVSKGKPPTRRAAVPDVTGEDETTATADLDQAGFTVATAHEPTDDPSADGTVVDEQPAGGASAAPGSKVTITIGDYTDTTAADTTATATTAADTTATDTTAQTTTGP